jgi:para-nitrobenzyl esterase
MAVRISARLLLLLSLAACDARVHEETRRITIFGPVIGTQEGSLSVWRQIPFAQPPIGELRWRAPLPPLPWTETLTALEAAPACFQRGFFQGDNENPFNGSEDCLYLNIWAPTQTASDQSLPVMVWIHGGANTLGSAATYNPSHLVNEQSVIVVTIAYRLASFGWFRHPSLRAGPTTAMDDSGNFGTLDTIAALRFVQDNIAEFGGDPNNITIFGESAGGHNVAALLASPLADGLFQKAIIQSGIVSVANLSEAESDYPSDGVSGTISSQEILYQLLITEGIAEDLAGAKRHLGNLTTSEIASYLRAQTPANLLQAEQAATPRQLGMTRIFPDGVVVRTDGIVGALKDPARTKVPVLVGTNRDETKLFNAMNPHLVEWGQPDGHWSFIDQVPLAIKNPDYYQAMSEYGSGFWKLRATDDVARSLTQSEQTVFAYRFDWDELPTIQGLNYADLLGAGHAMELLFLFPAAMEQTLVSKFVIGDGAEAAGRLSQQMRNYWSAFAYSGDPNIGLPAPQPTWPVWQEADGVERFLILDSDNHQGIVSSTASLTLQGLLAKLEQDTRFDLMGRCQALYGLTYRNGDSIDPAAWETFAAGQCLDRDYQSVRQLLERQMR